MELKGSKTEQNLKDAFSGESQANRRYLYFASKADVEGYNDVAALFRSTAEGETGHAHGHLDFLKSAGDPATDKPIGSTDKNLQAAVAGETYEYTEMYPPMLAQAEAGLALAERNFRRFEALHAEGAASDLELDIGKGCDDPTYGQIGIEQLFLVPLPQHPQRLLGLGLHTAPDRLSVPQHPVVGHDPEGPEDLGASSMISTSSSFP